uniref:Transposase-associated domain-containing protein n=1 Tax=Setaria italica TaxID=4555 RepID=K3ZZB5_SETIT
MDQRVWMYGIQRHSPTFMPEVAKSVEVAKKHARICKTKQICCPCFDCSNKFTWEDTNIIKRHLIKRGFVDGYTIWSHHGEARGTSNNTDINTGCDEVGGDDANDNNHVMMDDDYDRRDQTTDQTSPASTDRYLCWFKIIVSQHKLCPESLRSEPSPLLCEARGGSELPKRCALPRGLPN